MIELELLGGNGDRIVMTDEDGQRYSIIVDDALRAAVRRAGPAALSPAPDVPSSNGNLRPRALQALMRAGASAEEVAQSTGMDVNHVRRFEGAAFPPSQSASNLRPRPHIRYYPRPSA